MTDQEAQWDIQPLSNDGLAPAQVERKLNVWSEISWPPPFDCVRPKLNASL